MIVHFVKFNYNDNLDYYIKFKYNDNWITMLSLSEIDSSI